VIHVRIDGEAGNDRRRFTCGIGPSLPEGDTYVFDGESELHGMVTCVGCGGKTLGTPISQLSGRPGTPGFDEFKRIAGSWGYE
jgi:hypothetical protein